MDIATVAQGEQGAVPSSKPPVPTEAPMPSIGRIVHYRLRADQAEQLNARRDDGRAIRLQHPGFRPFEGNFLSEGQLVAVWGPSCVNGQVLLDGSDSLWVTSALAGDGPGTWSWPPRS